MQPQTSGYFSTPNNTPSGKPMVIAVDNPYMSVAEFLTTEYAVGLGLTTSSPIVTSGRLQNLLKTKSSEVNRICRRWFDTQTIDETKSNIQIRPLNPQLVTMVMQNRPYQQINTLYIQVLKWFIQIDTGPTGYLQDFPDKGYFRIVPLLSNSGAGAGSPMPAEIVDKTPLGVLWANYTFGYGTAYTNLALAQVGSTRAYQAPLYYQLWAPSQPLTVYNNGVAVASSNYTIDYPNGIVTFTNMYLSLGTITIAVTSNETIPFDIKQATMLLTAESLGQGASNPTGAKSLGMQTFNVSYGDKTMLRDMALSLLEPYQNNLMTIIS
jgi:hypothetical protein